MPINKPKISDNKQHLTSSRIFSGEVSLEVFLRDYWQKKPLLIRNAFPDSRSPITAEELAGLACEEDVNARIVIEKGDCSPWQVQYGPFDEDCFEQLPDSHWTLLVNDVEKHVPKAKVLFDEFRFIPDWRKDDLMISYAADGGSVGPHLDAYDVFLIQIQGQRNWKISYQHCNSFIEDIELKILSSFDADEDWVLDSGDMLYLPPNLAHYGIAKGPCMTASVGFRAPSVRSMISEFSEYIANHTSESLRYSDPNIQLQSDPSEISAIALSKLKTMLSQKLIIDDTQFKQWFGEYMSDARAGNPLSEKNEILNTFDDLKKQFKKQTSIQQSPFSHFLYTLNDDTALLFVDGKSYSSSVIFAKTICRESNINIDDILATCSTAPDQSILLDLFNRGCIS